MRNLTLLIKPASSLCNMRCTYCFYKNESENRLQKSMGIMDKETMECLIRKAMDYIGENGTLMITFQGGEPTLANANFFENFIKLAERLKTKSINIYYSLQMNGFDLTNEMILILKKYHVLVGSSLDGYEALHDSNRMDANGNGTWNRILQNVIRLRMAGIEINVLCVITKEAVFHTQKIYMTLKSLGFRYQQYIACLDPMEKERGGETYSLKPVEYGEFLKDLFD